MGKHTIKEYKQGNDVRWYAGIVKPDLVGVGASGKNDFLATDTSKGVCYGLAIWWIIKSANGEDFWTWMAGPGPQVTSIKSMFRAQTGDLDVHRFINADESIKGNTKLTKQCKILMNKGYQFVHKGYYYISLRGNFLGAQDSSGHAIAAYLNPDGKSRYFDPNLGEFETDTLNETLGELKTIVMGYQIKNLEVFWCCWN